MPVTSSAAERRLSRNVSLFILFRFSFSPVQFSRLPRNQLTAVSSPIVLDVTSQWPPFALQHPRNNHPAYGTQSRPLQGPGSELWRPSLSDHVVQHSRG